MTTVESRKQMDDKKTRRNENRNDTLIKEKLEKIFSF